MYRIHIVLQNGATYVYVQTKRLFGWRNVTYVAGGSSVIEESVARAAKIIEFLKTEYVTENEL